MSLCGVKLSPMLAAWALLTRARPTSAAVMGQKCMDDSSAGNHINPAEEPASRLNGFMKLLM